MAKVPDGRSLVETYAGQSFSLLGVNTDAPASDLKQRSRDRKINWRSFADGGTSGPITRTWGVTAFPTTYLIDHEGVVRGVNLTGADLRKEIDDLIAKAK